LAGLSAALHAQAGGRPVRVWEAAGHAGGRCRSFFDERLNRLIDNGNHLVLSGNDAVQRYLRLAGAPEALVAAPSAAFPFIDIETGERWTVSINDGPLPVWALDARRRPAGVGVLELASAGAILFARADQAIGDVVKPRGAIWRRFWEPMSYAVMNLPPEEASAVLMRRVMLETFARDGRRARPMFAPSGLGPALIEPAVTRLKDRGGAVTFAHVAKALEVEDGRVRAIRFGNGREAPLQRGDSLIIALPPDRLNALLPGANAPEAFSSILNAHFVLEQAALAADAPPILGVLGGVTQWIFPKKDVISLTVSAAEAVEGAQSPPDILTHKLWEETKQALGLPDGARFAASRLIREKRATFRQRPADVALRPQPLTGLENVFLAGDCVDTGLPATIEGAVRSGETAARLVLRAG
jgi:squalene-associated FAD-dependent desaturase